VSDWSNEETDEPLLADHRNFYKVEKRSRDGQRVERMLWAGQLARQGASNLQCRDPRSASKNRIVGLRSISCFTIMSATV
jgi:hypothetical protein